MNIDRETWKVVGPLFDRLLELEQDQRRTELDAAGLTSTQRAALTALLEAHESDDDPLSESAAELLGIEDNDVETPNWTGRRLGPWLVEERLAEGGMSVVHAGSRADGRFEMAVAIKVLKTERLHIAPERLNAETRILARVQHPGIARLIDSGADDDGRPYLIMERIEGTPIHTHCRDQHLELRDRVELVLSIADALEFAHQRQVVHCDIKPANVLVRADGRPGIVDFGISVLVRHGETEDSDANRFQSPGFAAPERYENAPPDTAQDIYSLGAVLAELVIEGGVSSLPDSTTGRRTPTLEQDSRPVPRYDGSGAVPREVASMLRRAMASEPGARYRSMSAFADDLRAWLSHRPVAACEGGRVYVIGKWLRRHRVAAALGSLAGLSLIVGAGIALHQAQLAREEAARAVAVRDFTIGLFNAADPTLEDGEDPAASELLQRGADRVAIELDEQPELQAEMLQVIGAIQLQRGLIDASRESLDRAIALDESATVSPAVRALALSGRGMVAYEQGDLDATIEWLGEAHRLSTRADLTLTQRAEITTRLADMHIVRNEPEPALALIEPLLEELEDVGPRAYALRVQGGALERLGRFDEAAMTLERALDAQAADDPDNVFYATILNELGLVRWGQGRLDEAASIYERSLAHKQRVYGETHPQTITSLSNLAVVRGALGDFESAERAWRESLVTLIELHGDIAHPDLAYHRGMLANVLYRQGAFEAASDYARQGMATRAALLDDDPVTRWLPALTGLIALETDAPDAAELLGPWDEQCADLDSLRQLGTRFCLARAWRVAASGDCHSGVPPAVSPETLEELEPRWRAVHAAVTASCEGTSVPASDELPRWIRTGD